jgi:hypothetical protein
MKIGYSLAVMVVLSFMVAQAQTVAHYRKHGSILLPDSSLTPGAAHAVSQAEVEKKSQEFRDVPESEKKQVCSEYGAKDCPDAKVGEIDHLCPVAICHDNSLANLWWQPAPQYHWKDILEAKLVRMVRAGAITPEEARIAIESDWSNTYLKYVGPFPNAK